MKRIHRLARQLIFKAGSLWIVLGLMGTGAEAHDFSTSYSQFDVEGNRVHVALTLGLSGLHAGPLLDTNGDGRVEASDLEQSVELLWDAVGKNFEVRAPDPPVARTLEGWNFTAESVIRLDIEYRFDHAVTDLTVVSNLDRITQENHRHLLQIGKDQDARYGVLTADAPRLEIDYAAGIPFWVTLLDFVALGIEHIFTGYDHLAFLIGLLLVTSTLLSLAKVVTFFTVGHSVTLALATLGIVVFPTRWIESLIALSIAYIGVENFMGKRLIERRIVTFLFGLVHGFGFSNVLRNMNMPTNDLAVSLFSFNIGVEIGQLLFIGIAFPLLFYLSRTRWREHVIASVSVVTMCMGFYWFVQRAFTF